MKLILHDNGLNVRGTSTAMYDYAINLKNDYGVDCFISYDVNNHLNDNRIIKKFKKEFDIFGYNDFSEVDNYISSNKIDAIYLTKSGYNDGKISKIVPNFIHAVFPINKKEDIHGQKYAFISEWLSDDFLNKSSERIEFIPYMLNLPTNDDDDDDDYRKILNIEEHFCVVGRYGGMESFDIPFVYKSIEKVLKDRKDIVFLFCNTFKFIDHPRVIFTNSLASLDDKVKFLNTCDIFLHARSRGETFGLSILEAMSKSIPILTYGLSPEKNHYKLLNGKGLLYSNERDVFDILMSFNKHKIKYDNLDEFDPKKVIKKFFNIFLS